MELTVNDLIEINKTILSTQSHNHSTHQEAISANRDTLKEILHDAKQFESVFDQAGYVLAGIPWAQPFSGGNKRTAFAAAKIILAEKNYTIEEISEHDVEFLLKLLFEIQDERSQINPATLAKIILYLRKRTIEP